MDKTFELIKKDLPGLQKNILLKDYTTFKIGGPAKYFFIAKNTQDLLKVLRLCKKYKLPIFILGGGSNILFSDKGLNGMIIKIDFPEIKIEGNIISAGAGANMIKLAYMAFERGLSGLEWSAGMPGTLGGSIYGNAQAIGQKISGIIKNVQAVNIKSFEIENFSKEQCEFSLKNSIFKKNKKLIIIFANLELKEGAPNEIKERMKEMQEYRRNNHPMNFPSAGSVFVNPECKIKNKKILEKYPELSGFMEKGIIPAGFMIEKSGLSGKKKEGAQISQKHCNFIVNLGGAKAKDVIYLAKLAQKAVKKNFGLKLEKEIQLIGLK